MNISSENNNNIKSKHTDDKYSKSKKNNPLKSFEDITNNFIDLWKKYILSIKEIISKYNIDNIYKYNENID